jgi:hypothetical protein
MLVAKRTPMLLRHRPPTTEPIQPTRAEGFEHVPDEAIEVLRWLASKRVEFVLVGAAARTIRGERFARGPVAIVPAPYGRNLDRLSEPRFGPDRFEVVLRPEGAPAYEEVIYEATRFAIAADVQVEVAAPEDIELYDHVRRTGALPQMKLTRNVRET